jgi:Glyoxalase-like domain
MIQLDHIVFAARTLQEGRDYLEAVFDTPLVTGGQHLGFGTHNQLLKLGETCYLELIALDPTQVNPEKRPLFGLSSASVISLLRRGPQLLAWVARSTQLNQLLQQSPQTQFGSATLMQRDSLQWHITHRTDGEPVPELLPTLIDWGNAAHPCTRLPVSPVTLDWLAINSTANASGWINQHCHDRLIKTAAQESKRQLIARFTLTQANRPARHVQIESLT